MVPTQIDQFLPGAPRDFYVSIIDNGIKRIGLPRVAKTHSDPQGALSKNGLQQGGMVRMGTSKGLQQSVLIIDNQHGNARLVDASIQLSG